MDPPLDVTEAQSLSPLTASSHAPLIADATADKFLKFLLADHSDDEAQKAAAAAPGGVGGDAARREGMEGTKGERSVTEHPLFGIAQSYVPHLTSLTMERLLKEPTILQLEQERLSSEMETLAVQNYGAFIASAKTITGVREQLTSIEGQLDDVLGQLEPLQRGLQSFQSTASGLDRERQGLRNLLQHHNTLIEILEIPQLLSTASRNGQYDETLDGLAFAQQLFHLFRSRGHDSELLTMLEKQVADQKLALQSILLHQLKGDIHLPACVRIVGYLRRLGVYSEEELQAEFLARRSDYVDTHRRQTETLTISNCANGLRGAADLLRTHICDVGMHYKALFGGTEGPLSAWLLDQVCWFVELLRAALLPTKYHHLYPATQPLYQSPDGTLVPAPPMDASSLAALYRQTLHTSSTLKRLGCQFFPSAAVIFDLYLEDYVCGMLDRALLNFNTELERYNWVPSTALSTQPPSQQEQADKTHNGTEAQTDPAAPISHQKTLKLTRHRPLAIFANEWIAMCNELRQCALRSLRPLVVKHCTECLMGGLSLLKGVQRDCIGGEGEVLTKGPKGSPTALSATTSSATSKQNEFTLMCKHYAEILIPLVASHLAAIYGTQAHIDQRGLVLAMEAEGLYRVSYQPSPPTQQPQHTHKGQQDLQSPSPSPSPAPPPSPPTAMDHPSADPFSAEMPSAAPQLVDVGDDVFLTGGGMREGRANGHEHDRPVESAQWHSGGGGVQMS
ncbi:unnamed protein product [Vitrella brassicaformis CCMP3155]|uniref:Conserved oligomeric Golgi complex subunit 8 n=1 Tax=Vitrella brassicaformis (strain CCMP3155) TaxID=1169540 RepID=A0A0G4EYD8_VITBC|nr:unnamed protein product [Vitrella brassicaformis CCMP3155]|eukprot:CEM04008.1 unnamed protein product [Vitrella brassicaformis CCMP3155]